MEEICLKLNIAGAIDLNMGFSNLRTAEGEREKKKQGNSRKRRTVPSPKRRGKKGGRILEKKRRGKGEGREEFRHGRTAVESEGQSEKIPGK